MKRQKLSFHLAIFMHILANIISKVCQKKKKNPKSAKICSLEVD